MESDSINEKLQYLQCLKNGADDWTENVSNAAFISNFVESLNYTLLYRHLDILLPYILKLTDHYRPENKIAGIRCLTCVIRKIYLNDLKSRGIHDLIFDTLKRMLHQTGVELIGEVLPCLLHAMKVFKFNPKEKETLITRCDDVMFIIIRNIELTSDLHLRTVYMKYLKDYIEFMDSAIIKHNKKLVSIICDCLSHSPGINDLKLINNSLNTLTSLITTSSSMIDVYNCDILFCLFKLTFSVTEEQLFEENEEFEVLKSVKKCANMLKKVNESEYNLYLQIMNEKCKDEKIISVFSI